MKSVLRNRTFRRLFLGRLVTNAGDSLYYVAAMWLVYNLGGSAFYTGLAGALTLAPQALQFLAGPLVDRWRIGRTLVGAQIAQAALVLVVPAAARGGPETYGLLLAAITGGALVGALVASPLKRRSLSGLSAGGFGLGGVFWLAALAAPWTLATAGLLALAWVPVAVTNVVFAAFKQSVVPDGLLGRVSSVGTSVSVAAAPVGSLLGGAAGDAWGPTTVVAATGVGFLFLTVYWVGHPVLRGMPAIEDIDPARYGLASE